MNVSLENVAELMEERGITADDIGEVVAWGEGEGGKLIDGDRNLARKRLGKAMIYVEYCEDGTINDVYSHRVTMNSEK